MRILLAFVGLSLIFVFFVLGFSNRAVVVFDLFGTPVQAEVGLLVVSWFALGALVSALVAVIEGTTMRFENRRLHRDIRRLETEINFLRTQPAASGGREPDALEPPAPPSARRPAGDDAPPSAPVYGVRRPATGDEDDDVYTGGSAV